MKSYGVTAGLSGSGRITFIIDPKQKIVSVIEEDEIDEHREVVRNEVEDIVKQ
jgi:peroxiredoxin